MVVEPNVLIAMNRPSLEKFEAELELWSPERPRLYEVVLESSGDSVRDRVGFRHVETRGSEIWLNGEPVFLCGISIHEEAPSRPGRAFSEEDAFARDSLVRPNNKAFIEGILKDLSGSSLTLKAELRNDLAPHNPGTEEAAPGESPAEPVLTAEDDANQDADGNNITATVYGSQGLDTSDLGTFTAWADLTSSDVQGWVEAAIGADEVTAMKAGLDAQIGEIVSPGSVTKTLS